MKHLPIINSEVIPHKEQRYNTAGDFFTHSGEDWYYISKLPQGWRAELAVFIHELVEFQLCKEAGKEEDITYFDTHEGKESNDPGTLPNAPYYVQHAIATKIEKYIIKQLGLNWSEYDASFDKLKYKNK
jgi:hypothetical protein